MKAKTRFYCTACGNELAKWAGKCPACGAWNTIEEAPETPAVGSGRAPAAVGAPRSQPKRLRDLDAGAELRFSTGSGEFDRVLGGGAVRGSLVLVGGAPGIGKSTLLLQMCARLPAGENILYLTGEESQRQLKLRAQRLQVETEDLFVLAETQLDQALDAIGKLSPSVVILDSVQTLYRGDMSSAPGSVTQVRECTSLLTQMAKSTGIPTFIVGHVNKDGAIAGPKVLEHMVDTVLYFEGERSLSYRVLRAQKNRYGSTNEIGVFQMEEDGLREVPNPSMMLLSDRPEGVSGTCVVCLLEGTRPVLAEVQALVAKTNFGVPRRAATGFDYNRTVLLIAVLEKRGGFFFGSMDTYINVVGGLRIDEPAADLPIALALVSNLLDKPLGDDTAAFGEIGLSGEIRAVGQSQQRVTEAYRMGFRRFILPYQCLKSLDPQQFPKAELIGVRTINQAIKAAAAPRG